MCSKENKIAIVLNWNIVFHLILYVLILCILKLLLICVTVASIVFWEEIVKWIKWCSFEDMRLKYIGMYFCFKHKYTKWLWLG